MVAVAYRGATAWGTTLSSWPAGTQQGDLAVLAVTGDITGLSFPGWTFVGLHRPYRWWSRSSAVPKVGVWYRTVPASGGTPGAVQATAVTTQGQLTTWEYGLGVGRVRVGYNSVKVGANGAVLYVWSDRDYSDIDGGISGATVVTGIGQGGPPPSRSWWDLWTQCAYETTSVEAWKSSDLNNRRYKRDQCLAVEILPRQAPEDPTLYTPPPGYDAAYNSAVTFEWQHQASTTGGYQDAVRLRYRESGTGTWYWVGSDGSQQATETTVVQAAQTIDLNSGYLTSSTTYEWQVATREGIDGLWSYYSDSSTFDAVTPPSVTITGPSSPVSDDLTPTLTWNTTTPEGVQTAFRVTVDELGYDTGVVVGSDTSYTLPVLDWANGTTYTFGVAVQQTGGSWSTEDTESIQITWTPPDDPTVAAANLSAGGIQVTVSGVVSGDKAVIQRTLDGGITWTELVPDQASTGSDVVVTDVTVPYDESVVYRAKAVTVFDGVDIPSGWGVATQVTSTDWRAYLVDSRDEQQWVQITIRRSEGRIRRRESAVTYGLGDSRPMVDHAVYAGQSGSLVVLIESQADMDALVTLLGVEDGVAAPPWPFILRWPPDHGREAEPSLRVAVHGSIPWQRIVQGAALRDVTLNWVEQE